MTLKELRQYNHIKSEIALREVELNEVILKSKDTDGTGSKSNMTSDIVADIVQEREKIRKKIDKLTCRKKAIEQYIDSCDSYIGEMLKMHYIKGKTWTAIAMIKGGKNTPDSVKKSCHRYIYKNP